MTTLSELEDGIVKGKENVRLEGPIERITVYEPKEGDVLFITLAKDRLSFDEMEFFLDSLRHKFEPRGVRVFVDTSEAIKEIAVVRPKK